MGRVEWGAGLLSVKTRGFWETLPLEDLGKVHLHLHLSLQMPHVSAVEQERANLGPSSCPAFYSQRVSC